MTVFGFGEVLLRYTPPNYEQLKDTHTFDVNEYDESCVY